LRAYAETPEGQIHYRAAGPEAGPPVLLVHQNPCSALMFEAALPFFANLGDRVLAPDLPGYGNSDPPRAEVSMTYYVDALRHFLDALGVEQADVLGHHSGASPAIVLAVDHPQRVRRLVVWSPPLIDAELARQLRETPPADYGRLLDELSNQYAYRVTWGGETFTPAIGARYLLEWLQAGPGWNRLYQVVGATDLAEYLPRVTQPTLIMSSRRDRLWSAAQPASERLPDARFIEMEGVSLNVVDEQPAAFADIVHAFLSAGMDGEQ
jgi:pimeloyl-ACP methyl ester carboxylesterase